MKRNSLRNALATLLLAACAAPAQDVPVPEPAAAEPAATHAVPPVLVRDVRVQTIGDERDLEALPSGLLFLDAASGRLMVADDDNPHGHLVCVCRDIDGHSFTNDLQINGHRILLNDAFSLQAEAGAVSLRHGTNSLLQILAADYGSLAPLTAAYEDDAHLLLTANAPADAILQTTTNLLDPAGWHAPDNAVVAGTTDAATTWRITLLDGTVPEFYRVLATVSRPVGIHANAPLHANGGIIIPEGQGLTMGTNTWTNLPDTNAFLTAETDAAALAALAAHTSATNPHGITAAGIGALTEESDPAALSALALETSARTAADSALDGRVGALEDRAEEYWCKWYTITVDPPGTNWIPVEWPARTVYCYAYMTNNGFAIALPNWTPEEDCTLHLRVYKFGSATGTVYSANGLVLSPYTGGSSSIREVEFAFRRGVGWISTPITLGGPYGIDDGERKTISSFKGLPDGGYFAPLTTNPVPQSSAMSPTLSPLSPAALLNGPAHVEGLDSLGSLDADPLDESAF